MANKTMAYSARYEEDEIAMGASLFESEVRVVGCCSEEEVHMHRCVVKGKRAKRLQRNNLFWWRHREWPSNPYKNEGVTTGNARARADVRKLCHEAKLVNVEDYDILDIEPSKVHRYAW